MLVQGMTVRVGIVGMGYWGPNLARNLATLESCELAWCCELDDSKCTHWETADPQAYFTPDLSATVVASPGSPHAAAPQQVLQAGKSCFVEKPLAHDAASAEKLTRIAD